MKIIKMLKSLIEFLKNEIARDVSDMIDIDGDYDIFGDEEIDLGDLIKSDDSENSDNFWR